MAARSGKPRAPFAAPTAPPEHSLSSALAVLSPGAHHPDAQQPQQQHQRRDAPRQAPDQRPPVDGHLAARAGEPVSVGGETPGERSQVSRQVTSGASGAGLHPRTSGQSLGAGRGLEGVPLNEWAGLPREGGASPAHWTTPLQTALALLTVDGSFHAGCTVGDATEPVGLHQGEVEFLIALGGSSATDGCGDGEGVVETQVSFVPPRAWLWGPKCKGGLLGAWVLGRRWN